MNVAFLLYNRPDVTRQVFSRIREARPERLLVVCDGPNPSRPGDAEKVRAVRDVVADANIDWPCDVRRNYAETNMGCRRRVSSGLDWVFEQVEEAIILEDDCLPDPTFFPYCAELLERYRADTRVMMISGDRFTQPMVPCTCSYAFTPLCHIWGWATWRRAWRLYDREMSQWPQYRDSGAFPVFFHDPVTVRYFSTFFESVFRGQIDTWDIQWLFTSLINHGLNIKPCVNLVENIGFGRDATHTTCEPTSGKFNPLINPAVPLPFPLVHPESMVQDPLADMLDIQRVSIHGNRFRRISRYAYRTMSHAIRMMRVLFREDTKQA